MLPPVEMGHVNVTVVKGKADDSMDSQEWSLTT
jgi:hypothetical protein